MKPQNYITDEEKEKCRKVADAYAELYEIDDVLVLDAGRYGYVKLQYYSHPNGFDNITTYTDSRSLFEDLWQDWIDAQLFLLAKNEPSDINYAKLFECLPKEKQEELMSRKIYFAKKSGMEEAL